MKTWFRNVWYIIHISGGNGSFDHWSESYYSVIQVEFLKLCVTKELHPMELLLCQLGTAILSSSCPLVAIQIDSLNFYILRLTICTASWNIQKFCVLPTQCICVFVWIWGQTAIISLYGINWPVFINDVYFSKAQWSLYVPPALTFRNSVFCPHNVFVCFVWIWGHTAIISLYGINWLVFITDI